jgi:hypothetical protein
VRTLLAVILTLAVLPGCGALRAYKDSFKGTGDTSNGPIAPPKTNWSSAGTRVTVVVYDNDWSGRCILDIDNSIRCDFGFERLQQDAAFTGGWGSLTPADARKLCSSAMFSVRGPLSNYGGGADVQACAQGLLELRFRELAPPPREPR